MMELKKLCLCLTIISVVICDINDEEEETFVPTDEWKVVKKGQKIPEGLHIRINLESGETEAKLLNKNENAKNAISTVSGEEVRDEREQNVKLLQLKEALKNIKNEDINYKTKSRFKSYDELKKDLDELNISPKSEAEILRELVEKHKTYTARNYDEEEILTILEDLEYLVHQFDNANEFVTSNGFNEIIYKNLNSTNREIKRETLKLLGASMQNNVKVKIHALETGSVDVLLRILALDSDVFVKYRTLFALSGLLRDFPYAQMKFIENAGLSVFSKLFEMDNLKLQLKMITLITDLINEDLDSRKDVINDDHKLKVDQYNKVNLKTQLLQHNYCEHLNNLLINSVNIETNEHDIIEKCLNAFYSVADDCMPNLSLKSKDILVNLKVLYKKLSEQSGDDMEYFYMLYDLCDRLLKKIERNVKSEL